jgi:hypothetical protein
MAVRILDIYWGRDQAPGTQYIVAVDFTTAIAAGELNPVVLVTPQANDYIGGGADWPFDTTDFPAPEGSAYPVGLDWPWGAGNFRWVPLKYTPTPADYEAGHSQVGIEDPFGNTLNNQTGWANETAFFPVYVFFPEPTPPEPPPAFPYTDPVLNVALGPNAITRMG